MLQESKVENQAVDTNELANDEEISRDQASKQMYNVHNHCQVQDDTNIDESKLSNAVYFHSVLFYISCRPCQINIQRNLLKRNLKSWSY
jgi:hypothetical protein